MTTMDLFIPVDAEQLVIQWLLDQDLDVGGRIYSELPAAKTFPAVRVHQFNDQQASEPGLWLMRFWLQIDVWGGPKKTTRTIADTIRALLCSDFVGVHDEGVVTAVSVFGMNTTADDSVASDEGKARPHCGFVVNVWAHPSPYSLGS